MPERTSKRLSTLGLAILISGWLWALRALLWMPPASKDALIWLRRGLGPNWLQWALGREHFIGYRPLTALSYTANGAIGGVSAFSFRAVDLGLYVAAGGALYVLARRWFGAWPALLAAVVYFLHPASEEVAYNLARRSYALSTLLALLGMLALSKNTLLAGVFFLLGIASNEAAVVPALLAPVVLAWRSPERPWWSAWPALGAVGVMGAARAIILRGQGGYGVDIVLPWLGKTTDYAGPLIFAPLMAGAAALYQALIPLSGGRTVSVLGQHPAGIALAAALGLVAAHGLWRAGWPGRLVLAWLLALLAMSMGMMVWFWRMTYLYLVPLGLAAAVLAHSRQRAALGAGAVLLLNMAPQSPLVVGMRPVMAALSRRAGAIHEMERLLPDLPPGNVYVILPYTEKRAITTTRWLNLRSEEHRLLLIAHRRSRPLHIVRSNPTAPDTVQVDQDAVVTDEGHALLSGSRELSARALPAGTSLMWMEGGQARWMGTRTP